MELLKLEKIKDGKYLKNYELTYRNKIGKEKKYVCRHLEHCRLSDYRNRNQQLLPVSETERWRGCVYS